MNLLKKLSALFPVMTKYNKGFMKFSSLFIAFFFLVTPFLASCGGGGGGGIDLGPKATVSGTVFDINYNPVSGAQVTFSNSPVTVYTDSNGYFYAEISAGNHNMEIKMGSAVIYSTNMIFNENSSYDFTPIYTQYNPSDVTPPSTPTGLTAVAVSSSQINFSWNASTDDSGVVAGYEIYVDGMYIDSTPTTSLPLSGLNPNTQYCFSVIAYDAAGNKSGQSSQRCATTFPDGGDTTPPTTPTNLIASSISSSQIDLSWIASPESDVAFYNIYKDGSLNDLVSTPNTTYSAAGLSPNTQYCFTVMAVDTSLNQSYHSNQACATTTTTTTITSQSTITGSDGIASFTLSDGSIDNIKVMDDRTGEPISDISAILVTDGTNSAYFLIDPNKEYAPAILNAENLSVTTSSSANNITPQAIGFVRGAYLTFMSRVVEQDKPTPLTSDRIPWGLSQYIIENYFTYLRTTTVSGLYNIYLDVYVPIGETVVTFVFDFLSFGATVVNHAITAAEFAISLNYLYWETYYNALGYSDSAEVDIYVYVGGVGAPPIAFTRVVIPKDPLPTPISSTTSISGKVVDSRTGEGLGGIELTLYPLGEKTVTASNGAYIFSNFSVYYTDASYTIVASKVGYDQNKLENIQIILGTNNLDNNISLNPIVSFTEEYRIVLEWGENPRDLDSHLWTPSIGGTSYHIYYITENSYNDLNSPPYADLDVDDTSSYGPETTTIASLQPGIYTYAIYHYGGSGTITTSEATVRVYDSIGLLQSFSVPAVYSEDNWWWTVFTIDGSTGQITTINTIDNSSPYSSFSLSTSSVK